MPNWTWSAASVRRLEGGVTSGGVVYLEGVEEELAVHANLPTESAGGLRHPDEDDVVDAEDQHQHQRGLGQFPVEDSLF